MQNVGNLIFTTKDSHLDLNLFEKVFSLPSDGRFPVFYEKLISGGLRAGKRYCMPCVFKIWRDYLRDPNLLSEEFDKPKINYPVRL